MSLIARKIVEKIMEDLGDRNGIDHALESIDDDIMEEIKQDLTDIVDEELSNNA